MASSRHQCSEGGERWRKCEWTCRMDAELWALRTREVWWQEELVKACKKMEGRPVAREISWAAVFSVCFGEAWRKKKVPAMKAGKNMSLMIALGTWAGGEQWCCSVSKWCPQWYAIAAAPITPTDIQPPASQLSYTPLFPSFTASKKNRHSSRSSYRCYSACQPAYLLTVEAGKVGNVPALGLYSYSPALLLNCISSSVSVLPFLALLHVQARWHNSESSLWNGWILFQ